MVDAEIFVVTASSVAPAFRSGSGVADNELSDGKEVNLPRLDGT